MVVACSGGAAGSLPSGSGGQVKGLLMEWVSCCAVAMAEELLLALLPSVDHRPVKNF